MHAFYLSLNRERLKSARAAANQRPSSGTRSVTVTGCQKSTSIPHPTTPVSRAIQLVMASCPIAFSLSSVDKLFRLFSATGLARLDHGLIPTLSHMTTHDFTPSLYIQTVAAYSWPAKRTLCLSKPIPSANLLSWSTLADRDSRYACNT